ncbi:MAG: nucleotidyltransferase family protein [Terriglobales bacterium]
MILAAGESSRMGSDKALLVWPPPSSDAAAMGSLRRTFLSTTIQALNAYNDMVIVVVGKNEPNLAPVIYATGASLVRNPAPEQGQFSSLQVGLREVLNRGRDAAMVTLVDRPSVKAETLESLRSTFEAAADAIWAVVPEYKGKHGHPIIVGREMIEVFLRAPATASARDIQRQYQEHIEYASVDDAFVAWNVDTPQDYQMLLSQNSTRPK